MLKHIGMPRAELQRSRQAARDRRAATWRWFAARKRARPFAGLRFFQRTNVKGSFVLASRHWPDSITWSWSVWWRSKFWTERTIWPAFGYTTNSGGTITLGPLEIHWQEEMPRKQATIEQERRFIGGLQSNGPTEAQGD